MLEAELNLSSENHLPALLEQSLVGTYIIKDDVFTYVNQKLANVFGYPREEIIGNLGPVDLTAPEDRGKVRDNVEERIAGRREAINYRFQGLKKNGETFEVEVHGRRILHQGEPVIAGTLVDRSSEFRARDTLRVLAWGIASHTGGRFFKLLVGYLTRITRVNHAFVGRTQHTNPDAVDLIALHSHGEIQEDRFSELRGELVREVREEGFRYYGSDLRESHPDTLGFDDIEGFAGMPISDHRGTTVGVLGVMDSEPLGDSDFIQDVLQVLADRTGAEIERLDAEQRIRQKERNYRTVFNHVSECILVVDPENCTIRDVNQQSLSMLGYGYEELLGKTIQGLTAEDPVFDPDHLTDFLLYSAQRTLDWKFETNTGEGIWVELSAKPCELNGQERILVVLRTIDHRKALEKLDTEEDEYDEVTGLRNRTWFRRHLRRLLNNEPETKIAVLYLDLDDFKDINAAYGHEMGDKVLKTVGERLLDVEDSDLRFARWESDVFLGAITGLEKAEGVYPYIDSIQEILDQPLTVIDRKIHPHGSIGYTIYPDDAGTVDALINRSDLATVHAKQTSGTQFHRYEEGATGNVRHQLELETDMRQALRENQFQLHYQPIFELASGRMYSVEALIRWQHPNRGLISPGEFLPIAESKGLMPDLDRWVLDHALEVGEAWYQSFDSTLQLSVNLSAESFDSPDIVERIRKALARYELPENGLQLEITESLALQDFEHTKEVFSELKSDGIDVALDDFGTGYSSFGYLTQLPLDVIKVDRTLIQLLDRDDHREVVRLINSAADRMNLRVMAEGIETREQLLRLKEYGCHYAQGFLMSRPVPNIVINEYLSEDVTLEKSIEDDWSTV